MNNKVPFMFMPNDNFNTLNDIKNLYSQINTIQQQLNNIEKRVSMLEKNKNITTQKPSPVPLNNNVNYSTDNYII